MDDLCSLSLNINYLVGNKQFFVSWFIIHKFVLNEIPRFESGICSTVAPA